MSHYQEIQLLLRDHPSETNKVFQTIADCRNAGADWATINHLLRIIFSSEEFVQHIPANASQHTDAIHRLLTKTPYTRRELASNVAAHFELLKGLSNDPDFYVQLNLKKQVEQRYDLQSLKINASHLKSEQEELRFIKDELNSIAKSIGVTIAIDTLPDPDTIAEFDDGFLIIGNNLLRIYLTETKPKENIEGIIYCERTYDLDLTPPSLHLNENDHKEREIRVYDSINELVMDTLSHYVRIMTMKDISLKSEAHKDGATNPEVDKNKYLSVSMN